MTEFNPELHENALRAAQQYKSECNSTDYIVDAYRDLVSRRGFPGKLVCDPTIQLVSGVYFDLSDPENSPMPIEDLAMALAKLTRYNGHTLGFDIYSIGQHCCLAADHSDQEHKFACLMHDAHEGLYGDMTTPLKQLCPDYKMYEKRGEEALHRRFGLPIKNDPHVKVIDIRMAATEKRDLMPKQEDDEWHLTQGVEPFAEKIVPWSPEQTYHEFINRFHLLKADYDARKSLRADAADLASVSQGPI